MGTNDIKMVHLSQDELDQIAKLHKIYMEGKHGGARAQIKFKNLSGLNLSNKDFAHADFTGSCFIGADLSSGNFASATFFACDLSRANLENACFARADFRGAFVAGANLSGADLKSADLREGRIMEKDSMGMMKERGGYAEDGTAKTIFAGARLVSTNMSSVRASSAIKAEAE